MGILRQVQLDEEIIEERFEGVPRKLLCDKNNSDDDTSNDVDETAPKVILDQIGTDYTFKRKIVWGNVLFFAGLHVGAFYGLYLLLSSKISTIYWVFFLYWLSGMGVTAGAHRLFSHKSYTANKWLQIILIFAHTISGQNSLYIWVREHRQHHKFSDTDADPHNVHRGFFFAHMGWLMSRKHPMVKIKQKTIDMSDLKANKLVMFQFKYYFILYFLCAVMMPVAVPMYYWNESFKHSLFVCYFLRYVWILHVTWLINSAAHFYGNKPFEKSIRPTDSAMLFVSGGEGWHNYHHVFPWDYRAAELGSNYSPTTYLIDLFEKVGWVTNLRCASYDMVKKRILRTGDGTHPLCKKD